MGTKGITITPKWIMIIIAVIGVIWGAAVLVTNLQAEQTQLQKELEDHLSGTDKIVEQLDSLIAVVNHHLQWDTIYVVTQGHLDEQQQKDIKNILERLREVEKR